VLALARWLLALAWRLLELVMLPLPLRTLVLRLHSHRCTDA
jgi:hypothetical protein